MKSIKPGRKNQCRPQPNFIDKIIENQEDCYEDFGFDEDELEISGSSEVDLINVVQENFDQENSIPLPQFSEWKLINTTPSSYTKNIKKRKALKTIYGKIQPDPRKSVVKNRFIKNPRLLSININRRTVDSFYAAKKDIFCGRNITLEEKIEEEDDPMVKEDDPMVKEEDPVLDISPPPTNKQLRLQNGLQNVKRTITHGSSSPCNSCAICGHDDKLPSYDNYKYSCENLIKSTSKVAISSKTKQSRPIQSNLTCKSAGIFIVQCHFCNQQLLGFTKQTFENRIRVYCLDWFRRNSKNPKFVEKFERDPLVNHVKKCHKNLLRRKFCKLDEIFKVTFVAEASQDQEKDRLMVQDWVDWLRPEFGQKSVVSKRRSSL